MDSKYDKLISPGSFWWGCNLDDIILHNSEEKAGRTFTYEGNNLYSLSSVLFKKRIITFYEPVYPDTANDLNMKLLVLDKIPEEDKEHDDIKLYINSPGGSIIDLLSIYDTMQHIESNISTLCVGMAASAASVMLAAGAKGKRYALPRSKIMLHDLSHGLQGKLHDTDIGMDFSKKLLNTLLDIYIIHARYDETGEYILGFGGDPHAKCVEDVKPEKMKPDEAKDWLNKWLEKDRFLSAEQAQAMGFIDHILPVRIPEKKK